MTEEIGGQGVMGLAFETTLGTYLAPTKWFPIRNETLTEPENKIYRTNIRGSADRYPGPKGQYRVEGDIVFEVTHDVLLYFAYAMRATPTKTGVGPYTYAFAPAHVARPSTAAGASARKTLSLLFGRASLPFGYTGVSVGQLAFSMDNGMLIATASVAGMDAAQQSITAQTWPTSLPYGPDEITLEVPSATTRADADTFGLTINDNLVPNHRLNGTRSPSFLNWGEREVTASFEHDFDDLIDYNAFKAQTIRDLVLTASRDANNDQVKITVNGGIHDTYQVNLSGLGDLVRASTEMHGTPNTDVYAIEIKTTESIT